MAVARPGESAGNVVDLSSQADSSAWDSVYQDALTVDTGVRDDPTPVDSPAPVPSSESVDSAPVADESDPSESLAPDSVDPVVAEPVDPLAGSDPFQFLVDGQVHTIEGAYRVPGEGLYVSDDKVAQFEQAFVRVATLEREQREVTERHNSLERLTRWETTGKDAQGNPTKQVLTGQAGLEARNLVMAEALAERLMLRQLLADPVRLYNMIGEKLDAEGNRTGELTLDPRELKSFNNEVQLVIRDSKDRARTYFSGLSAPPPPTPQPVESWAVPTLNRVIQDNGITGLTEQDKQDLVAQFAPYVEKDGKGNAVSIQPSFVSLVKAFAARRTEATKMATTGSQMDTHNNAMNRGRTKPQVRPPSPPTLPTGRNAPKQRTEPTANELWDAVYRDAASLTG